MEDNRQSHTNEKKSDLDKIIKIIVPILTASIIVILVFVFVK